MVAILSLPRCVNMTAHTSREDLRRWFLQQELDLFRYRFSQESSESTRRFLEMSNLDYKPVSELIGLHAEEMNSSCSEWSGIFHTSEVNIMSGWMVSWSPRSCAYMIFTRGQFWPPGIVVACVCVCVYQSLACPHDNSSPVQARITKFGPEKQNTLVKIPIVFGGNWPWPSRSNLTSNSKLTPFWACPNHYSPTILVRISKFGQQMHFSTVKIPVNSGLDWP